VKARVTRDDLARASLGVLALALLVVGQVPTIGLLLARWSDADGTYEHGPLVPLVALGLAWRMRDRLVPCPDARGDRAGIAVLAISTFLTVAGAPFRVPFVAGTSLVLALVGLALLLGGSSLTRVLAFPLGFLAFAVPLPWPVIAPVTFTLKLASARAAIEALSLCGIVAVRDGSTVHLANGSVIVEDVCSGLRSLVALLALGVLVAGLDPGLRPRRRVALAVLAAPIALAANAIRVAVLCGAVALSGPGILDSWLHEGSGLILFGSALALLLGARAWLSPRDAQAAIAERALPLASAWPRRGSLALAVALLAPAAVAPWALGRPARSDAPPIFLGLPLALGEWRAVDLPVEETTREILETRDVVLRRFERPGRPAVFLAGAASRGDRKAVHPPEVCFTGGGFAFEGQGEVELLPGLVVRTLDLSRGNDHQLVVYFYATGERLGPDFLKLQLLASLERIFDPDVPSALVRLSIQVGRSVTREEALEAARDLARELVPAVRKRLEEVR
jgi:EpsI family protein